MKVKALIKLLKTYDENFEVLVSSDEEGNSFQKLHVITEEMAHKDNNYYELDHPHDNEDYAVNCIVIWP